MLTNIRIKNFKAIKDTSELKLNPLTCFIGYNGSGKSSVLEALLTLKELTTDGLDSAMLRWKGFENVQFKGVERKKITHRNLADNDEVQVFDRPVSIRVKSKFTGTGKNGKKLYTAETEITKLIENEQIVFLKEDFVMQNEKSFAYHRDFNGQIYYSDNSKAANTENSNIYKLANDKSLFSDLNLLHDIRSWQFMRMSPDEMGEPYPQKRTSGFIPLNMNGSNVAEYLLSIKNDSQTAYESIVNTMVRSVLPYASGLRSELTSEVDRKIFLNLEEKNYNIPGWLLSTGTLRIVALLAMFRHPKPAPVVIIEELENGLDPRSIHLIVSEIRRFTEETGSQVIFTSHSPYLLDLLKLDELVFVEKTVNEIKFIHPANNKDVVEWADKFTPGKLYTMSRLNPESK
ncbi:MAG: AAA family ATPase [Bacteroidota bacterium]